MKRAKIISRSEVSGVVYLPGDEAMLTEEQLAFLKSHNAAVEDTSMKAAPGMTIPAGATMAEADSLYRRLVGSDKPKKEKRR